MTSIMIVVSKRLVYASNFVEENPATIPFVRGHLIQLVSIYFATIHRIALNMLKWTQRRKTTLKKGAN